MVVHKCDRCGKIVEKKKGISLGSDITMDGIHIVYNRPSCDVNGNKNKVQYAHEIDLCDDCLNLIMVAIENGRKHDFNEDMVEGDRYIGRILD